MFATKGLAGTSMREIARETGITQAAIYHHFHSKEELYFDAVRVLLREKMQILHAVLELDVSAEQKLRELVLRMLELMDDDPCFRHIFQRELMEGDDARLKELADSVFADAHASLEPLMADIAPHLDPLLLLMSVSGLVLYHLEVRKLIPLLPDGSKQKAELPVLAEHICAVVLNGVHSR